MAVLISSFVVSLIKAIAFGILAFIGIRLGKAVRDMKEKKR